MIGLVFADRLRLTPLQWGAFAGHAAGWLWWWRFYDEGPDESGHATRFLLCAGLLGCGLWMAFWNQPDSMDSWLLFRSAERLAAFDWGPFLDELVLQPYVKYQTPFLSFWFSRMPAMWGHQLVWLPFGLLRASAREFVPGAPGSTGKEECCKQCREI